MIRKQWTQEIRMYTSLWTFTNNNFIVVQLYEYYFTGSWRIGNHLSTRVHWSALGKHRSADKQKRWRSSWSRGPTDLKWPRRKEDQWTCLYIIRYDIIRIYILLLLLLLLLLFEPLWRYVMSVCERVSDCGKIHFVPVKFTHNVFTRLVECPSACFKFWILGKIHSSIRK